MITTFLYRNFPQFVPLVSPFLPSMKTLPSASFFFEIKENRGIALIPIVFVMHFSSAFQVYDNITKTLNISNISGFNQMLVYKDVTQVVSIDGNIEIPSKAFCAWNMLTSAEIGNSVNLIGNYSFSYCTNLKAITIGENVTGIGNFAFSFFSFL